MARVTIEDCLEKVEDRFELVALAAQRAKDISSGAEITIERNGEKDTVISLREIADETILVSDLKEEIITSYQSEKNILDSFVVPANTNNNEDSISIEEEEADIKAAIAEATESDIVSDEVIEEAVEITAEPETDDLGEEE